MKINNVIQPAGVGAVTKATTAAKSGSDKSTSAAVPGDEKVSLDFATAFQVESRRPLRDNISALANTSQAEHLMFNTATSMQADAALAATAQGNVNAQQVKGLLMR